MKRVKADGHKLCHTCRFPPTLPPLPSSPSPSPSPPSPISTRPEGCIDQLSETVRAAIITLHKVNYSIEEIAEIIHCSEKTIRHWINRWKDDHSLQDRDRCGRPRCTGE